LAILEQRYAEQADFVRKIYDTGVKAVIIVTGLLLKKMKAMKFLMSEFLSYSISLEKSPWILRMPSTI
jgi:hypothetical protein